MRSAVGVQQPFALHDAVGTKVAVAQYGAGEPIVCLHATGHGGRDYAAFADAMAHSGYSVFVVDWPGHGDSPTDATGRRVSDERYAELLT